MSFPLSRVMRMSDFEVLAPQLATVDKVLGMLNGGDKAQHPLRRWEYALALAAFQNWAEERNLDVCSLKVADHGCCTGMLAPTMFMMGHDVTMYEIWAWGNQQDFATWQMEQMRTINQDLATIEKAKVGNYRWANRPLNQLLDEDRNFDVVFCISTIEHIHNHEIAFRDLCHCVGPKGMLFITSDFAGRPGWGFVADGVRPDGMFCAQTYERLAEIGREEGLELIGAESLWSWDESCRLVNDYGFASLAMKRR